mmetsp:Transcript_15807/g.44227  ORF Transcript_15807/g.44227 Transcript_15807/m.44227 type:complete len:497 (-) Transcript_15807:660-2150(-)|eukprot:CAMPEP_0117655272 /NCGR_PEP_ID=MMETSP0804-20121206/4192_1 /TAXON_ID=1074897 /ORGANISM="Tetraselmis astigmatica, Strain CCMP880" /LENGTH=496 /DNA_ID=CAMNT_0005461615 /DNA_START=201 /DNA_END=1691 /DNA_ORIENTATION=+
MASNYGAASGDVELVSAREHSSSDAVGLLAGNSNTKVARLEKKVRNLLAGVCSLSVALIVIVAVALVPVARNQQQQHQQRQEQAGDSKSVQRLAGSNSDSRRVLLVSLDGFRWDYPDRSNVVAPNLQRLRNEGLTAEALVPVYPSKTFPNHYSIATGLYPPWHGIIHNAFCYKDWQPCFSMQNKDPRWWLGEPIWETVVSQGKQAFTYFWPGSEVKKGTWDCPEGLCAHFDSSVAYQDRVDALIAMLKGVPKDHWPNLMTLYFEETDHIGHSRGTNNPQITAAIHRTDSLLGYLLQKLSDAGALDHLHLIVLGDHGMVDVCGEKLVMVDKLLPDWEEKWEKITQVDSWGPVFAACIDASMEAELFAALKTANDKIVDNDRGMDIFLRDGMPQDFVYNSELSDRICPIIGVAREGYRITSSKQSESCSCGGAHGYSRDLQSMRTVFYGRGTRFSPGKRVPDFQNVEVYNIMSEIIGVEPAPNNGTPGFASTVLLPEL